MSLTWSTGPGEGWLDALFPSFQWMQIRPRNVRESPVPTASAEAAIPGSVGTAEVCFREPDGWISCVFRDSIWAQQKRDRGLPEVPQDAPEFVPPSTPVVIAAPPPVVVPSDSQTGVSENANDVAISWDSAVGAFGQAVDIWQGFTGSTPPIIQGPAQFVSSTVPAVTPGGSCSCNSNPCVCGTINGRPALVDPRTGKRCYRRRRRVMLTEGDFNTLLRIATLPNNANVRTALAKAIGRR